MYVPFTVAAILKRYVPLARRLLYTPVEKNATQHNLETSMSNTFRSDGLDSTISPNGAHPLYYTVHQDGIQSGPFSCPAEAESAFTDEMDEIIDHRGNPVANPNG